MPEPAPGIGGVALWGSNMSGETDDHANGVMRHMYENPFNAQYVQKRREASGRQDLKNRLATARKRRVYEHTSSI